MSNKSDWIPFSSPYNLGMKEIYLQQYHAAQFLAIAGRHLLPQKEDDSHTNFRYAPEIRSFVGNELAKGKRLGLKLDQLILEVLNGDLNPLAKLELQGKTLKMAYSELKQLLTKQDINTTNLKHELHYDTLDHPLKHGSAFKLSHPATHKEVIDQRQNAELVLEKVIAHIAHASPLAVWPHHFDTGTMIPLTYNPSGDLESSIGLGWAMADDQVDEPYFYLSFWSAKSEKLPSQMPELEAGKWMTPAWNGAILSLSELLTIASAHKQEDYVVSFFQSGIKSIKQSFNNRMLSFS